MGNTAAIGSTLVVPGGAPGAIGSKTSATTNRGGKPMFADTAPLARLREKSRSYNRPTEQRTFNDSSQAEATQDAKDSVELPVTSRSSKEQVAGENADPAEEETVAPAGATPVSEIPMPGDMVPLTSPEAEPAEVLPGGEPQATDGPAFRMAAEMAMVADGRERHAATTAVSSDGRMLNQAQISATVETVDGQSRSVQVQMNASVTGQGVETSGKVVVQEQAAWQNAVAQGPLSAETADAEEAKVIVSRQQTAEMAGAEPKVAAPNGEMAETAKSAAVMTATAAKSQTLVPADGQPAADASKNSDPAATQAASRASQAADVATDVFRQEQAQTSSQQDSGTRSQNPAQTVAAAEPTEKAPVAAAREASQPQVEMTAVSDNHSAEVSSRVSAQVASSVPLDAASTRSPVQDVGEQILNSVHASMARADKQIQVRLDPPELGTVTIRLSEQGDQIRGILEVGRDETRRDIEQALPQVLKGLQEAGVQVRRLEVVVSDQPDRGLARDQLPQDAWTQQQQHPDQQGYRPAHGSGAHWSATPTRQQGGPGPDDPRGFSGEGVQDRIDMLV